MCKSQNGIEEDDFGMFIECPHPGGCDEVLRPVSQDDSEVLFTEDAGNQGWDPVAGLCPSHTATGQPAELFVVNIPEESLV